jgi:hypothetical protein
VSLQVRNLYSVFGTAFMRKAVVVFTHADLLDPILSSGSTQQDHGDDDDGDGDLKLHGAAAAAATAGEGAEAATAVRALAPDRRLAAFLEGASAEVWGSPCTCARARKPFS